MSKWFKSFLLLTVDWSGTHTSRLSHPPSTSPRRTLQGGLTHPLQVLFLSNNTSVCVRFNCSWDICETLDDWVCLTHKRQLPSAGTTPLGFPPHPLLSRMHNTCLHVAKEWGQWQVTSFLFTHAGCIFRLCQGQAKRGWTAIHPQPAFPVDSVALRYSSASLWCAALVEFTKWTLMKARRMLSG